MKYKILGVINLLLGLWQLIPSLAFLFLTLPKLMRLYSEFAVDQPSFVPTYFALCIFLLMGGANLLAGFKLLSKSKTIQERYFKYGVILAIASFFLPIIFIIIGLFATLRIYNLISQF